MTQKQILSVVIGVVGLGAMALFMYAQFARPVLTESELSTSASEKEQQPHLGTNESVATAKEVVIPETIDDISQNIQAETATDLSALDAEESGAVSDIEADSQSVNNLGTSYDENNL